MNTADLKPNTGTPRWVKASGVIANGSSCASCSSWLADSMVPTARVSTCLLAIQTAIRFRGQLLVLGVLAIAGVVLNWSWLVGTRAGQLTSRLGERSLSRWRWPAMPSRLRKSALTVHVCSSVSFLGAVACFLVLALTGLMSREAQTVTAAYVAMDAITIALIVPLSVAALLTDLFQSLGTRWGYSGTIGCWSNSC